MQGCGLENIESNVYLERGGAFNISCTPRRSGEVRMQILINGEMLAERRITVRSLSSWTKEDAAEWVLTLGIIEPSIRSVARDLSQEFVNQNVTGAKIAGGLLDRGALHFAFGLQDMDIAQFFANVILDLNKGQDAPKCYMPWSWTQQAAGKMQFVSLDTSHIHYTTVAERFLAAMPNTSITSIQRVENVAVYERYFEVRTSIAYSRGGNPNERFLWYCAGSSDAKSVQSICEEGFDRSKLDALTKKDHMVLGYGFHFAPDAKVADYVQGASAGGEKSIIFARVTCGGTATRDLLGAGGSVLEDLSKVENRIAPPGFHSATSQQRTELMLYYQHCAYPEFKVTYKMPYQMEIEWPERKGSSLLKLEEVHTDL